MTIQQTEGYISGSAALRETDQGSADCTWILTAVPGQVINITLIDFHPTKISERCQELGYVKDMHNGHEALVCSSDKRTKHLYQSSGAKAQVTIGKAADSGMKDNNFLIYYEGMHLLH